MPARSRPIVAIDGPAGAGKSTVSRRVAERLGFVLVDTGAMYRAVALAADRAGIAMGDGRAATAIAEALVREGSLRLSPDPVHAVKVELRGEDVTSAIRAAAMGPKASAVSLHPGVRTALLDLQRQAGRAGGVVLEGRDIGTVVFPDAEAKFFLTARPEIRARRRYDELVARGEKVSLEETLRDVLLRDAQDTTRAVAPLRAAEDAETIDASDLDPDEVVRIIVARVQSRLA